jgi:flagellin
MSYIEQAQKAREKNSAQMSSGKRLTSASVDPAAMAIVEKMISQLNGLNQAQRNVQDGISMMQTAEGAMSGIGDITQRINELTVQASNGTYTDDERRAMQLEVDQLVEEVNSMASRTEFNAKKLLDGSLSEENGGLWIQDGANAGQQTNMSIGSMTAEALGLSDINFVGMDEGQISAQIGNTRGALNAVTDERAKLGAYINRMEYTSSALGTMSDNMEAAKSRIADADMARAAMDSAKAGIMQNVSISMLRNMMTSDYSMRTTLLNVMGP